MEKDSSNWRSMHNMRCCASWISMARRLQMVAKNNEHYKSWTKKHEIIINLHLAMRFSSPHQSATLRRRIAKRVGRLSVEGEDANNSDEAPPYITSDQTQPDSNRKHTRSDVDDKAVSASRAASCQRAHAPFIK